MVCDGGTLVVSYSSVVQCVHFLNVVPCLCVVCVLLVLLHQYESVARYWIRQVSHLSLTEIARYRHRRYGCLYTTNISTYRSTYPL